MKGVFVLGIFLFCAVGLFAKDLVSSEFMAANANGLKGEDGDRSDWIEILSSSSASVSLALWSLTDDAAQHTKWTFPSLSLGANQRLLVFASLGGSARSCERASCEFQAEGVWRLPSPGAA